MTNWASEDYKRLVVKALTILGIFLALGACGADPATIPTIARDLTKPASQKGITIPLTPFPLVTEADYDRFEDHYLSRIPSARQHTVYEAMWQAYQEKLGVSGKDQRVVAIKLKAALKEGWGDEVLILLERLALLHLKTFRQTKQGRRIIELAEILRGATPKNPKAIFVLSYARSIFLTSTSQDNTFRMDTKTVNIARKLLTDWRLLLTLAPDYKGPFGWNAERIRKQIMDLENAEKTYQKQATGAGRLQPARHVDLEAVKAARSDLWNLENAKPGKTKSVCAGRLKKLNRPGKTELEHLADLRCAFEHGDAPLILGILETLAGTKTLGNVCTWVNRVDKRSPSGLGKLPAAQALANALTNKNLPPCPALQRSR